eukprot:scaffold70946_cov35-Attheya_sp.AAC.1
MGTQPRGSGLQYGRLRRALGYVGYDVPVHVQCTLAGTDTLFSRLSIVGPSVVLPYPYRDP